MSASSLISCKYPGVKIQIAYPINLKRLTHTFHMTESDNVVQKTTHLLWDSKSLSGDNEN